MNHWLSVIGTTNRLETLTEDPPWCFVSPAAQEGDVLFIYVASSHHRELPESGCGIVAMYEIMGTADERVAESADPGRSSMGGGRVVAMQVALTQRFAVSLLLKDMRADRILSKSRYVGYNFRGICFRVSPHQAVQIRSLIAAKCAALNLRE